MLFIVYDFQQLLAHSGDWLSMNILYDENVDGALPAVDKQALLQALQAQLPDLDILHAEEDLKPYECDGLSAYRTLPLLVLLPHTLEQVQGILRLCFARKVRWSPVAPALPVGRRPAPGKRRAAGDGALQQDPRH